jgi:carbon starvation protein CstA
LVWALFGVVLVDAVHDFGALVLLRRSEGQTVGDVAAAPLRGAGEPNG